MDERGEGRGSLSPLASGIVDGVPRSQSPLSRSSVSPSSSSTGGSTIDLRPPARVSAQAGDVSPTVHAFKAGSRFSSASVRNSLGRVRPALFRRRSSGQLSGEGSFLGAQYRSGGSSSGKSSATNTIAEGEPMTPTRSGNTKYWEGTTVLSLPRTVFARPKLTCFTHRYSTLRYADRGSPDHACHHDLPWSPFSTPCTVESLHPSSCDPARRTASFVSAVRRRTEGSWRWPSRSTPIQDSPFELDGPVVAPTRDVAAEPVRDRLHVAAKPRERRVQ